MKSHANNESTAKSLICVRCLLCEKVKLSQIFQPLTYPSDPLLFCQSFRF